MKSVEKADKIVVMNEGKVESVGRHDELLKNSDLYKEMVKKSQYTEKHIYWKTYLKANYLKRVSLFWLMLIFYKRIIYQLILVYKWIAI